MVKVFFGKDQGYTSYRARTALKKILNSEEYESMERFDAYKDSLSSVLEAVFSISLFQPKKTILVSNCYFFQDQAKKIKGVDKENPKYYPDLENLLLNPPENSDVFFVVPGDISRSGSPNKALSSPAIELVSCDLPSADDYVMLAYKLAKEENKDIDKEAAQLLYERTKGDYLSFKNNIDKLFAYTDRVRRADVEELVYRPLEDKVYTIASNLVKGNTSLALRAYQELRKNGNDALGLLPVFASQFSFMALVKYLSQKRMSRNEIASELSATPGRVYHTLMDVTRFSYDDLINILSDLFGIEKDIKLNLDDADYLLELFIIGFRKKYQR